MIAKWKRSFSQEAKDYLNSYPAYQCKTGGLMDNDKQIRDPEDFMTKYRLCVQECTDYVFSVQDAEKFIKWLDPMWCEYKGITDSGFFKQDSVTLDDEEDFIV